MTNSVPERRPQLSDCCACLVGDNGAQRRTLEKIAARTGFVRICNGVDELRMPSFDDVPVPFFFFHYKLDARHLQAELARIRTSVDANRRFSPTVLMVGACMPAEIMRFVALGIDDIVLLPEAAPVLRKRFAAQLNAPITYFETSTYFGPDRRRAVRGGNGADHPARGSGQHRHVRYVIRRAPHGGIQVLRRDVIVSNGGSSLDPLAFSLH